MRMSVKPKGVSGVIFLVLAIVVGVVVAYSSGVSHSRSATRVGYIGNNGWDSWSGTYELLDGKMSRTLHINGTKYIKIDAKTESGVLSVEIKDTAGNVIFSKSNIGTASQSISVDGNIVVTISADKHSGSFAIG